MKKIISIVVLVIAISLPVTLTAQNPPHPNGGNPPSGDANRVGHGPENGAPVGSGTIILTLLAAAYGGRKVYNLRTAEEK